ncbi:MAG: alpha-L-fucosidase [Verrucomicrobia bacterium]|nr:alpha-L-fucosidase [Verrucomicrobiota bacterium]
MRQTGAGFVVLTTSHAFQYFPAPLATLEKILPGRTSKRDLVADLAAALGQRGIKLMLYYHLGASDDSEWLKAAGFWDTDTSRFFGNWQAIITEAGERYKDHLAGWWFDDGSTNYYYRSAPWEKLDRAAKAGFSQRLVGFNPWELNSPTEFQDYFTGEGFEDPRGYNNLLVRGGDGCYPAGTHQGLQASACLITEGDWVHTRKDSPVGTPRWNAKQLAGMLKEFVAYHNVPLFNLEIYQEGTVSPPSVEIFEQAAPSLPPRR